MDNTDKIKQTREFFVDFLKEKGYKQHEGLYSKGFVIIRLMFSGKMLSIKDANPDHIRDKNASKTIDIAFCKTPCNLNEADVLYKLLGLGMKEIGSKAYKRLNKGNKKVEA